jgi:hypothetical protein
MLTRKEIADQFIAKAFPNADPPYHAQWRRRFASSTEWQHADLRSRYLLQSIAPDVYPSSTDLDHTPLDVFQVVTQLTSSQYTFNVNGIDMVVALEAAVEHLTETFSLHPRCFDIIQIRKVSP